MERVAFPHRRHRGYWGSSVDVRKARRALGESSLRLSDRRGYNAVGAARWCRIGHRPHLAVSAGQCTKIELCKDSQPPAQGARSGARCALGSTLHARRRAGIAADVEDVGVTRDGLRALTCSRGSQLDTPTHPAESSKANALEPQMSPLEELHRDVHAAVFRKMTVL